MSLLPTAPRSIGGVLDDAIRLYRKSLPSCLLLTLLAALLIAIPAGIFGLRAASMAAAGPEAAKMFLKSPLYWIAVLVIFFVYLGFYNALILNIHAIASGEASSLKAALGSGIRRAPSMLGLAIAFFLVIAVGFILLVIPGIYFWGIFQLSFIALLVENASVFESFGISRRLIKGHWWRSTTIVAVAFIIMIVFSIIAGIISGIMVGVLHVDLVTNMIVQQGVSAIINVFLLSLFPSFLLAMYYDLKLRNEGTDLEDRIGALNPAR